MTKQEIIEAINLHIDIDTGYKMFGIKNKNGEVGLGHNVTFDISNAIPDNFFAPYFEVNSIEEARLITKAVLEQQNNYEQIELFESTFNKIIESKKIDLSKKLFLSIYKPDRLKILTN